MILCNARVLSAPMTGIPRYVRAMLDRMGGAVATVRPAGRASGLPGHLWEQVRLPAALGRDLLWSPATTGPLAVRRQVVTVHDVAALDHPEWFAGPFGRWHRFLLPRLLPRVAHVLTVSEHSKSRIVARAGVREDRVSVIPCGVDRRFAPPGPERAAAAAATLALPSRHYILSLCSLEPRKNMGALLKAWAGIQDRLPEELWLVLAGGRGPERVFGEAGLDRLPPRVHLCGRVPDELLPPLLGGAVAFVYPSLYEGFGLPPLEAMACGTPCVTSATTSLPEVAGDAALLVPPEQPGAIGEAILRLARDEGLRQLLARRGLARAALFDWDRSAGRTLALLEAVRSEGGRRGSAAGRAVP